MPERPIDRDFPAGRRPPECPGACSCTRVCGQAVIDGRGRVFREEDVRPLWQAARSAVLSDQAVQQADTFPAPEEWTR